VELIKSELELARESQKLTADKNRRDVSYKVGDRVFLNRKHIKTQRPCRKLDHKQFGPFEIIEKIGAVAYRLELPPSMRRLHNVFHVSLLERATQNVFEGRSQEPPPPIEIDNDIEYEVEDILDV